MIRFFIPLIFFSSIALFGQVEESILPSMNQVVTKDLKGKVNAEQSCHMEKVLPLLDHSLRLMSFNMLFNHTEDHLEPINRWENRKERMIEYILYAHPDVIGSQELQSDQLDDLLAGIGKEYDYYGIGAKDGKREGDIPAIFYLKERLDLVNAKTFYFSETPEKVSDHPFNGKNTFTFCHFRDKKTGKEFLVLNTHLAFGNIERRLYEACKLRDFLLENPSSLPVCLTGDFNTFSFRQELDLPFYDGDAIVKTIEKGDVVDSMSEAMFGHFGPISSTNFCSERKKPFCSQGTPGIILDHIFVKDGMDVITHGIDPARVNGHFPSDHLPVIVDVLL